MPFQIHGLSGCLNISPPKTKQNKNQKPKKPKHVYFSECARVRVKDNTSYYQFVAGPVWPWPRPRGGGRTCGGRGGRPEGPARGQGHGTGREGASLPAAASPASQGAVQLGGLETPRSCRARPPPPSPLLRHTDRQGSDLPRPACSQSVMFGQERGGAAGRSAGHGTPAARRNEAVKTHGY